MNPKYNFISVAEMLRYIASHDKAKDVNTDLTILRETVIDPVSQSKFYIGKFRCYFEELADEKCTVTCPGLRIFHMPLTEKTVDLLASRYDRRLVAGHAIAGTRDLDYLFYRNYHGVVGYWYYDERTGARRAYLYHGDSGTSYILKFDSVLKFIVDESGQEHCVREADVITTIENLAHPAQCDTVESATGMKSIFRKLSEWLHAQKPLDSDDARILEENLWNLAESTNSRDQGKPGSSDQQ